MKRTFKHSLEPQSSTQPKEPGFSRRQAFSLAGCAALGALASGCVPAGESGKPDLVWGRRGMSESRFLKPRAMTIDSQNQLYIVDTTGRIQVFDDNGQLQRSWSTPETANGRPTGMAVQAKHPKDGQPRLLVADTHYYQMLVYTLDGELLEDENIGGVPGHSPGEFAFVTDAVCDDQGCYYIGEYGDSDRIQKFDPDGKFMTQWGGTGSEPGKFVRPQSLVINQNVLWVADACNHRIQRFDILQNTPELIDIWGREGEQKGEFGYPYDLAFASDDSLIVCEYRNQRLQRFSPEGQPIATWGGHGFSPGQLYQPWGVVIDSNDRVHVLDSNNHRVQRLRLFS